MIGFPIKVIFQNLNKAYNERMKFGLTYLKENNVEAMLRKPSVSDRIKGKILMSLDKH